jgi:hypothetical protein
MTSRWKLQQRPAKNQTRWRLVTLAVSLIVAAGAVGVGLLPGSPVDASAASCPTMEVVVVRGSGEHSGFGSTLSSLYRHVHALDPSAHADSIDYPAVDVHPWEPRYNRNYEHSVERGEGALREFMVNFSKSRCGRSAYVYLVGYSQGAEVVDGVFQSLDAAHKARVGGVVLFGDPRFNPAQTLPVDVGTFDHSKSGVAVYQFRPPTGTFGTLAVYRPAEAATVRSYCADHDQICNYSSPAALIGCAVSCAHYHYMDLKFGHPAITYTQAAAEFLVMRRRDLAKPTPSRTIQCELTTLYVTLATNIDCATAQRVHEAWVTFAVSSCTTTTYPCRFTYEGWACTDRPKAVEGSVLTCHHAGNRRLQYSGN